MCPTKKCVEIIKSGFKSLNNLPSLYERTLLDKDIILSKIGSCVL